MIKIRYLVTDVDKAVEFYTSNFEFRLEQQFGPALALLERDGLELIVTGPKASGSKEMPDGTKPIPGGWSRFLITVDDIESVVSRLKQNGVQFRNEIHGGPGGKQILCLDPDANVIELYEPDTSMGVKVSELHIK